jgi:hypothetical protein
VPAPDATPPRPARDHGGRVAYLPPRAAKARKLILRSQLGRGWIIASAVFGILILVAGVLFLTRAGRPGPPWVRVAPLSALPAGAVIEVPAPVNRRPGPEAPGPAAGRMVVVDRRDDRLRAFLVPPGPCPVEAAGGGFARPCTGHRWDATGAPAAASTGGGRGPAPLRPVRAQFAHGDLYVDPS